MTVKIEQVRREAGSDLFDVMSHVLTKDAYQVFVEIIANSYDSDATLVDIVLDEKNQIMTIKDNGTGMDEEGLDNFYLVGGSPKLKNRTTQKGRRTMGHYGVATIILKYLTNSYTLSTVKDGIERIVEDEFEGNSTAPLNMQPRPALNSESGTKITITNPKFTIGSDQLNAQTLKHRLGWEIPQSNDFVITINGKEFESRLLSNATEYRFERVLEKTGYIQGSFYYFPFLHPNVKGIWVYVNRRAVGDPMSFNLEEIDPVLNRRLFAKITADGLEDSITFDRNFFQETLKYQEFYDFVRKYVESIVADLTPRRIEIETEKVMGRMGGVLEGLKKRIVSDPLWKSEKPDIELSTYEKSGPLATYNQRSNIFFINAQHPLLEYSPTTRRASRQNYFGQFMVTAISHAIAKQQFPERAQTLDEAAEAIMERASVGSKKVIRTTSELHPDRIYTMYDLESMAGISRTVANELMIFEGRVRKVTRYGTDANEMRRVLDELKGLVPIYDTITGILRDKGLKVDRRDAKYRTTNIAMYLRNNFYSGIIGWPKDNPVYFVGREGVPELKERIMALPQFNGN